MEMENKFFEDLDKVVRPKWSAICEKMKGESIVSIEIEIDNCDIKEVFNKYLEDNKDYFHIHLATSSYDRRRCLDINYYYKGKRVDPICYYVKPKCAKRASQLDILRECIRQDTNNPDIRHLEMPDKK